MTGTNLNFKLKRCLAVDWLTKYFNTNDDKLDRTCATVALSHVLVVVAYKWRGSTKIPPCDLLMRTRWVHTQK